MLTNRFQWLTARPPTSKSTLTREAEEKSSVRTLTSRKFSREFAKHGNLNGNYRLIVAVGSVRFADGSVWTDTDVRKFSHSVRSSGRAVPTQDDCVDTYC